MSDERHLTWDNLKVIPRLAGMVARYHTHPTLVKPTVAEHVYNMMRVWYLIWGPMKPHISTHLLWHDSGELVTSDVSFRTKRAAPEIRPVLARLEAQAVAEMGGPNGEHTFDLDVSEYEEAQVKVCDLIEMLEYAIVEIAFGNKFAHTIVDGATTALQPYLARLHHVDAARVDLYLKWVYNTANMLGVELKRLSSVQEEVA